MTTAPHEKPELPETEPVPTWSRDLRRVLGISFGGALCVSFFIWLASIGLMFEKGSLDRLEADAVWAGICAGVLVFLFPFLFFEIKRVDNGFRRHGLVPLVLLGVAGGGVIITAVMMIWPLFLGDRAVPGTVAAELGGDPASILLVLFFVIAGMAWCLALMLPMMVGGYKVALALLLPYLGTIFVFPFAAVRIFENPPNAVSTVIWAGLALAGMAVLTILAALRNVIGRPVPQMTDAERAEAQRRYLQQRQRFGHTNGGPLPGIDEPPSQPHHRQPNRSQRQTSPPQRPPHPSQPPRPPHLSQPRHLPQRSPHLSQPPHMPPRPPHPPRR